jgi:glycosyltransferase involved in cell wall biosynthesis
MRPASTSSCNFAGGRPQSELGDFYQAADILVNPSYSESFGLSLVESLACGRPVVATRGGGMVEIVDGQKVGLLVERGDAAGLAEALVTLLEDDTQRAAMGRNGRALVAKHFTWAKVAETLLSHYAALPEQTH